jgi:hypothetical protein
VTDDAQIDADQSRNFFKRLTVHPVLAARNDRQLPRSKRQQFFKRTFIRQDIAREERYLVFAKELLSAQAAGSTRLPVHLNRLPRWRSSARHDPYRRCRPKSNIAVDERQPISKDPHGHALLRVRLGRSCPRQDADAA